MSGADPSAAWYRQPIVWLGALIMAATICACIAMITLAWLYPDPPLPTRTTEATKVPPGYAPVARSSADDAK
jgi:hypothetical protein